MLRKLMRKKTANIQLLDERIDAVKKTDSSPCRNHHGWKWKMGEAKENATNCWSS